jgi:hypothetical protein
MGDGMFYAEFAPHGVGRESGDDRLMGFIDRQERDDIVRRINDAHWDDGVGMCARPLSEWDAARRYDLDGFDDDRCSEVRGLRTFMGRRFDEIRPRPAGGGLE